MRLAPRRPTQRSSNIRRPISLAHPMWRRRTNVWHEVTNPARGFRRLRRVKSISAACRPMRSARPRARRVWNDRARPCCFAPCRVACCFIIGVVMIAFKGKRKAGQGTALVAFVVLVLSLVWIVIEGENKAIKEGFQSVSDQRAARRGEYHEPTGVACAQSAR